MPNKKINILYIIDYFHRTGGTEKHLVDLVRHLPRDCFDSTVVVFDLGTNVLIDNMRSSGVSVIHLPLGRVYVLNAFLRAIELRRTIKAKAIDIVQTFQPKADSYGALVARVSGVKHIVCSKRDTGEFRSPWYVLLNRFLKHLFDRVIVVSDAVADAVVSKEGVRRDRICTIYNGVDTAKFAPPTREEAIRERRRWGLAADDFVVGMVAGFRPEKNYDAFFAGARKAMEVVPSLKVLAVGGGPLLEHFRAFCSDEALRSRVVFAGDISDVAGCLKAMDVACLTSNSEGFSNAVVEKMAVGLPVVVTGVGGNREAVINEDNGIIVAPGDWEAVGKAIVALYGDAGKRVRMGRRSREIVEEKFSAERMYKSHEELYVALCS